MAVAEIDTPAVLRAIEPHWLTKTETMSRVRGRIEAVLDWCTVRGYRTGDNPARWKGHLAEVLPARGQVAKVNHHAALAYADRASLHGGAAKARRRGRPGAGIHDPLRRPHRRGDRRAMADEIDLEGEDLDWYPAGRMKGGKEHRVPLSERAMELLRALPTEDGNDFVFLGSRTGSGLSNMAMTQVLQRMDRGDITVHGFRSASAIGPARQRIFPTTSSKWRWRMRSRTRSRPPIGAAICWPNADSWPRRGRNTARRRHRPARCCRCGGQHEAGGPRAELRELARPQGSVEAAG